MATQSVPVSRTITTILYALLELAFVHFNEALGCDALPEVMLTLERSPLIRGSYRAHGWTHIAGNATLDEISLTP